MCGIIGYVGRRQSVDLLMQGLERLEYRGYDSAGVAWLEEGEVHCVRAVGQLSALGAALTARRGGSAPVTTATEAAEIGIGHTRWATHGGVTEMNAHPHADVSGRIRIVLNGIVENYVELRDTFADDGVTCVSETDAEVVAHLIARHYEGDLVEAVRGAVAHLRGHYAIVALSTDEPETLVGVRQDCPLVAGLGDEERFIASSISAFLPHTRTVAFLHDGEIIRLTPDSVTVHTPDGAVGAPTTTVVDWDDETCGRDGYETFMLKEIHEQGRAVADTLARWRADAGAVPRGALALERHSALERVVIVGCGTSYHAGLAGRLAFERWARLAVEVEVASEFRYRNPIVGPGTLVVGITQSGETADTLAAMRLARARGATVIAVTNAPGSQATREADGVLFTSAGIEMGVAATKTFVAQIAVLYGLALHLAAATGGLAADALTARHEALAALPRQLDELVTAVDAQVRDLAERLVWSPFFLYMGRLAGVPVALEGALKLKEISYVPTDAYAAGEMKHGPIALLGPETPVICVAIDHAVLPKLLSNVSEVRARGARVLAVASEGSKEIAEHAEEVVYVPDTDPLLQVILAVVPLQLFAYHLARARGLDVDRPRNLAKTVTVE